jgi:hypothetical protein
MRRPVLRLRLQLAPVSPAGGYWPEMVKLERGSARRGAAIYPTGVVCAPGRGRRSSSADNTRPLAHRSRGSKKGPGAVPLEGPDPDDGGQDTGLRKERRPAAPHTLTHKEKKICLSSVQGHYNLANHAARPMSGRAGTAGVVSPWRGVLSKEARDLRRGLLRDRTPGGRRGRAAPRERGEREARPGARIKAHARSRR